MSRPPVVALLVWLVGFSPLPSAHQTGRDAPAALPRLQFENLPVAIREQLGQAYDQASADPRNPAPVGRLGMLLHAYQQYGLARECYRTASRLEPGAPRWRHLSGITSAELGDHSAAVREFSEVLTLTPDRVAPRLRLADALAEVGKLDASRLEYQRLAREHPDLALSHAGLGRVLRMLGDSAAAVEAYRRALALDPKFGAAHYAIALAYRDIGLPGSAAPHLDAYRSLGSTRPAIPDAMFDAVTSLATTARDLIASGAQLGGAGRLDEAIALHLQALDLDPAAAQAHVNLISLYGQRRDAAQAEAHYRRAVELGTSLAEAHYNYGVLLAAQRRADAAAAAFRLALEANPFHAQAHNNMAALLAQAGDLKAAVRHYESAVDNDPRHASARLSLARALIALGRPMDALAHLDQLLSGNDEHSPRYLYTMATAWLAAGEPVKAADLCERALQQARALGQHDLAERFEHELRRIREGRR